ncbi:MAG: CRISPR-associated helicase Cas3' [Moorellaceae bacterium]
MDELLAKPDVPFVDHLWSVLRLGDEIARRLKLDARLRLKAILACALHDIGKVTVDFQEYMRGKRGKAYPHALASMPFALVAESLIGRRYRWQQHDLSATAAVLTHHSPLGPELYKGYTRPAFHPKLSEALEAVWELLQRVGVEGLPACEEFLKSVQFLLKDAPVAILDGRGAIPGKTLRGVFQSLPPNEFARVKAVLHLADWLASAKKHNSFMLFLEGGRAKIESSIRQRETEGGFLLCEFQRLAAASPAGVLCLRAPTGTGKTEALLLWAGDTERLLYLLPTQATVNAMWKRLRRIYGDECVALAHGKASYILRRESDEGPLDKRLFGSVFAKPVTVATLDQYLLAHLNGRHWEERRSLSQQATLVLDEIHAYEPYTLGLLVEALEREKPSRLALASATLPPALLELFPKGELIEAEDTLWRRTRHRLMLQDGSLQEGMSVAVAYARQGKTVLIVANTIADAQSLYQALRDEFDWGRRHLLHARFTFRDRQAKEAQVGKPLPGTIFIATQVVEVSLDVSYDVLMTEVAPIDAIVQRMGRVNRRGEKLSAPVIVYRRWSEGAQRVYGTEILEWSLELLESLSETPTDRELADAAHKLYEHVMATEDWKQEFQEGRQTLEEVQRILGCYTINLSDEEMRERFTARRGQVSVEVLPHIFVREAYEFKERGEGWRLPELLVPVPIYWLRRKEFFTPIEDLHCIQTTLEYSSELGLIAPAKEQGAGGYVLVD